MNCTHCLAPLILKESHLDTEYYICSKFKNHHEDINWWRHSYIYKKDNIFIYFSFYFSKIDNYQLCAGININHEIWIAESIPRKHNEIEHIEIISIPYQPISSIKKAEAIYHKLLNLKCFS